MFSAAASRTAGSARTERQRAQHVADDAAQPVVDLDLGEVGLGRLAGRLAGDRVEQADVAPASLTMKTWPSALRTERSPSESAVSAFSTAGSPVAPSSRTTASIAGNPLAVGEFGDDRAQRRFVGAGRRREQRSAKRNERGRLRAPDIAHEDLTKGCPCRSDAPARRACGCSGRDGAARKPVAVTAIDGRSAVMARQLVPLPPHLPVATLKLPHDSGARQSEIRSLESGR